MLRVGRLKYVLRGDLEETRIRGEVLHETGPLDIRRVAIQTCIRRIAQGRIVEKIETIRPELQVLLAQRGEVFEK